MTTFLAWISGVVGALTTTASPNRTIKSEDSFRISKQKSSRNPPAVARPSLFGAWLTDTVTYHH